MRRADDRDIDAGPAFAGPASPPTGIGLLLASAETVPEGTASMARERRAAAAVAEWFVPKRRGPTVDLASFRRGLGPDGTSKHPDRMPGNSVVVVP